MARNFIIVGATILLLLGMAHGLLTLRDLVHPRSFTPTDNTVRKAMQEAKLALNPRANLWQAWLGFNLSHSLGVVIFGAGVFALAFWNFGFFCERASLQGLVVLVVAAYFVLSVRFWFWAPALGTGVALLFFVASTLLLQWPAA